VTGNPSGVYPPTELERTLKFRTFNSGFIVAAIGIIVSVVCLVVSIVVAFRPKATVDSSLLLCLFLLVLLAGCLFGTTRASCVLVTRNEVTVRRVFRRRRVAIAAIVRVEVVETVDNDASVVQVQLFSTVSPPLRTPLKASRMLAGRATVEACRFALTSALELRGFCPGQSVVNDPG